MDYRYFMKKALDQAEDALAEGEFPVACIMVYQGKILVTGSRKGTIGAARNEIDHAEMVALRRFSRLEAAVDPAGVTAFTTMEPCLMCFSAIMLSGIRHIVYAYEDAMGGGTSVDRSGLAPLYRDLAMTIVPGVCRKESLALFKRFFLSPENRYWKNSALESYTLAAQ